MTHFLLALNCIYLFIYLGEGFDSLETWKFLDPSFKVPDLKDSLLWLISVDHFPNHLVCSVCGQILVFICIKLSVTWTLTEVYKDYEFSSAVWKEFAEVACVSDTSGLWISVVPSNIPSEREVQKGRHQKETERWNRLLAKDRWHPACTVWTWMTKSVFPGIQRSQNSNL